MVINMQSLQQEIIKKEEDFWNKLIAILNIPKIRILEILCEEEAITLPVLINLCEKKFNLKLHQTTYVNYLNQLKDLKLLNLIKSKPICINLLLMNEEEIKALVKAYKLKWRLN